MSDLLLRPLSPTVRQPFQPPSLMLPSRYSRSEASAPGSSISSDDRQMNIPPGEKSRTSSHTKGHKRGLSNISISSSGSSRAKAGKRNHHVRGQSSLSLKLAGNGGYLNGNAIQIGNGDGVFGGVRTENRNTVDEVIPRWSHPENGHGHGHGHGHDIDDDIESSPAREHVTRFHPLDLDPTSTPPPAIGGSGEIDHSGSSSGAQGKRRRRTSPQELQILEEAYKVNTLPSSEERSRLAKRTGMSARAVQIWFQNKRQTEKRRLNQALYPNVMIIPIQQMRPGMQPSASTGFPTPPHHPHHHHHSQHPHPHPHQLQHPSHPAHHHPGGYPAYGSSPMQTPGGPNTYFVHPYPTLRGITPMYHPYPSPATTHAGTPQTQMMATPNHGHLSMITPSTGGSEAATAAAAAGGPPPFWAGPPQHPGSGHIRPTNNGRSGIDIGMGRQDFASSSERRSQPRAELSDMESSSPIRSSSPIPFQRGARKENKMEMAISASASASGSASPLYSARSDSGSGQDDRLSAPRPFIERSLSQSAPSSVIIETPLRPRSSLGFAPSPTKIESNQEMTHDSGNRALSRGILDEMCQKRELPYPRKESTSNSVSDKVFIAALSSSSADNNALVTPVKQVMPPASTFFMKRTHSTDLWDRMDSDPPSMSPANMLRDGHGSPSDQSDTDVEFSPAKQPTAPNRRKSNISRLCCDADADVDEDEDDDISLGGLKKTRSGVDKPTLRRLASLDYYAGSPAKRSTSLGAEVRRLGSMQERLFISRPPTIKEPIAVAADVKNENEQADEEEEEENEDEQDTLHVRTRIVTPALSRSGSIASNASSKSVSVPESGSSLNVDPSRLMPDLRTTGEGKKHQQLVGERNEERDEECARLLLGLGMFGSGTRA